MHDPDRERSPKELALIEQLERVSARLPGTTVARDGFGHTTFKVGKKSFVIVGGEGDVASLSIKSDLYTQDALTRRGPWIRTPYIGQHGWITLTNVGEVPWDEIEVLVVDGWRAAAPKKLLRQLE